MNNILQTSTTEFCLDSVIVKKKHNSLRLSSDVPDVSSAVITKLPVNLISSIEVRRNEVRKKLGLYYKFANKTKEIDFIVNFPILVELLPGIAIDIEKEFGKKSDLLLEIFSEGEEWNTLFIIVDIYPDMEKIRHYKDKFLDVMIEYFPNELSMLNIDFTFNAFQS